jgi:hypothetical protein
MLLPDQGIGGGCVQDCEVVFAKRTQLEEVAGQHGLKLEAHHGSKSNEG